MGKRIPEDLSGWRIAASSGQLGIKTLHSGDGAAANHSSKAAPSTRAHDAHKVKAM
jgi:hypothetical protein